MFLVFQTNFKQYVSGRPIGKQLMKKSFGNWMSARKKRKCAQQPNSVATAEFTDTQQMSDYKHIDEEGIFLILLFYYFQDAAIVHFSPIYTKATDPLTSMLKKFIGGLLKFQF